MTQFGISQGRLVKSENGSLQCFPQSYWMDEFHYAKQLGFDYIELLAESKININNPIWSSQGIQSINKLIDSNNLRLYSICDNYLLKHLIGQKDTFDYLYHLCKQAQKLNLKVIVLPLQEMSNLTISNCDLYISFFKDLIKKIEYPKLILSFEITSNLSLLKYFFQSLNSTQCKFTYDSGNFSFKNIHFSIEDFIFLSQYLNHVHLKDKNDQGQNVLLGTGNVNFKSLLFTLKQINYEGSLTFETSRLDIPLNTAKNNLEFIKKQIKTL